MSEKSKKLYVELEVIEAVSAFDIDLNKKELYPYDGIFLVKFKDGSMSVVNVVLGFDETQNYCSSFISCYVGCPKTINPDRVIDSKDVERQIAAMHEKYDADLKLKKTEMEADFEKKNIILEHQYEKKMLELENTTAKRFGQGEWVSGKTLTEIIKNLTEKNNV